MPTAITAASAKMTDRPTPAQVLQRTEAERRDPVAHLYEAMSRPDSAAPTTARSRWPKLIVSGSSAEHPIPARPKASTPSPRRRREQRHQPERHRRHERQQPVGVASPGTARSIAANTTRPSVTIAQNTVSASDAIAVEAPTLPVMYSVAQLPLVVSTIPYRSAKPANNQNARRQPGPRRCASDDADAGRRAIRSGRPKPPPGARRSGSPPGAAAPTTARAQEHRHEHRRQRRPQAEQRVEVQNRPSAAAGKNAAARLFSAGTVSPKPIPRRSSPASSIRYGSGPAPIANWLSTSRVIAARSPTRPARKTRLTPERAASGSPRRAPPRSPRGPAAGTTSRRPCSSARSTTGWSGSSSRPGT